MQILVLFGNELRHSKWLYVIFLAGTSGLSSAIVLATINAGAASATEAMPQSLALLIISILIFVLSQKAVMVEAAELAQEIVHHLRNKLLITLDQAELEEVETINRSELYSCINSEMRTIADGTANLMVIIQAILQTIMTMVYLAWLSPIAFLLAALFVGLASSFHLAQNRQIIDRHEDLFKLHSVIMERFSDIIGGFREFKLSSRRATDLSAEVRVLSARSCKKSLEVQELFANNFVASQVSFFMLAAIMVFVVPTISDADSEKITKLTATALFLIGPISTVVGGAPTIQRMNAAAEAIMALQGRLGLIRRKWSSPGDHPIAPFSRIALVRATFSYDVKGANSGFTIGPIDMEIPRGKVVFITGGNGSGKSTLLKLITSLYMPSSGSLLLDDSIIQNGGSITSYRNLFSAIFSDNHLFKTLYGIDPVDSKEVGEYLRLLELEEKVKIKGRSFSTIALSSGQRKRLALVGALLEDREIYVLDEWAADQDPHYRHKFYHEVIPMLKLKGKTVIAVTHDERYFDVADVRYHMDRGKLNPVI